jgi:hypothetical protein
VLGGLLLLVWLLWFVLVKTLLLSLARTVVFVSVVRRTLPRRLVVLCLLMLCLPGCLPVLGRLSGFVLRLVTRQTSGLLALKGFDMWLSVLSFIACGAAALACVLAALVFGLWPLAFVSILFSGAAFCIVMGFE